MYFEIALALLLSLFLTLSLLHTTAQIPSHATDSSRLCVVDIHHICSISFPHLLVLTVALSLDSLVICNRYKHLILRSCLVFSTPRGSDNDTVDPKAR